MRALVVGFALLLVSGCAGGYAQFYTDTSAPWAGQLIAPRAAPSVVQGTGNMDRDVALMWQEGYALVGYSSFNGPFDPYGVQVQARQVGAERIIRYAQHTGTEQGAIPYTTTRAVTTYETGTANAYGSGGSATGTYSGTSTTYVPTTNYIPYSVSRYDQTALFFAPMGSACFGALLTDPTDTQRRAVGTNNVAVVDAVRTGSPVYLANLLPGDLLLSFAGMPVLHTAPWRGRTGQTVEMTVARPTSKAAYERVTLSITLGQCN